MGFSRQEYWSGFPFPSVGDLLDPETEPGSVISQADSLPSESWGSPNNKNSDKRTTTATTKAKKIEKNGIIKNILGGGRKEEKWIYSRLKIVNNLRNGRPNCKSIFKLTKILPSNIKNFQTKKIQLWKLKISI